MSIFSTDTINKKSKTPISEEEIATIEIDGFGTARRLASGWNRTVYVFDQDHTIVLKTMRADRVDKDGFFAHHGWLKRQRPFGAYIQFVREIQEYIKLQRRTLTKKLALPIPHIYQMIETPVGLGVIYERIGDVPDAMAPTLYQLLQTKRFTDRHREAMKEFQARAAALNLVLGDANQRNFVFTSKRNAVDEWVLVDGFGAKTLIPIHQYISAANRFEINKTMRKIWKRIETAQ